MLTHPIFAHMIAEERRAELERKLSHPAWHALREARLDSRRRRFSLKGRAP